jgi:hypothetical protein
LVGVDACSATVPGGINADTLFTELKVLFGIALVGWPT